MPGWSSELSLDCMARNGVECSILSLSAPATSFMKDRAEAASVARKVNEYAASLRDQKPGKFGFFATLPSLDDVEGCVREIAYSLDTLHADGVTLLTSYDGKYLGHPIFLPIWTELNKREAVVFIHPAADLHAGALKEPWLPPPIIDFPHETTRTAVHLIISDTRRDNPNCKIILSHGGGTLPYMATRIAHQSEEAKFMQKTADEFLAEAQSFYFDLALTTYSYPLSLLQSFAKKDHILYGSDFPFAREKTIGQQTAFLNQYLVSLEDKESFSIRRGAALKLFPRLARHEDEGMLRA